MSLTRPFFTGLFFGLIVPPVLTKIVVKPKWIDTKFDEAEDIRHEIDHIGWHIRHLQEEKGFKEAELFTPTTYYQDLY